MADDFTLDGYRTLLEAFLARGYRAVSFAEAAADHRHLVLRHDLDVSLEAALPLARLEQELGLRATYFVLLSSELYNPAAPPARRVLAALVAQGHAVGLHFDPAAYGQEGADLEEAARSECSLLESLSGRPVEVISFHRPKPDFLGRPGCFAGRRHAYESRFFRDMGYCSDSRGAWHHGHPLDHPALAEGRGLQLLTHPVWWTGGGVAPDARLQALFAERVDRLDRILADNCAAHRRGAWRRGTQ